MDFFSDKSDNDKEVLARNVILDKIRSVYTSKEYCVQVKTLFTNEMVKKLKKLSEVYEATKEALVVRGKNAEEKIFKAVNISNIDLIRFGTNIRPKTNRLYLGPRVENSLQ